MNHEYRNKIANESGIIGVKRAGIMNIEGQMILLPPPIYNTIKYFIYPRYDLQYNKILYLSSLRLGAQGARSKCVSAP